jgi:hypothetical protein
MYGAVQIRLFGGYKPACIARRVDNWHVAGGATPHLGSRNNDFPVLVNECPRPVEFIDCGPPAGRHAVSGAVKNTIRKFPIPISSPLVSTAESIRSPLT